MLINFFFLPLIVAANLSVCPPPAKHGTLSFNQSSNVTTVTFQHPPLNLIDSRLTSVLHDLMLFLRATPREVVQRFKPKVVIFESANPDFFLGHIDLNVLTEPFTDEKADVLLKYVEITRFLQNITSTISLGPSTDVLSGPCKD